MSPVLFSKKTRQIINFAIKSIVIFVMNLVIWRHWAIDRFPYCYVQAFKEALDHTAVIFSFSTEAAEIVSSKTNFFWQSERI